jgi:hypothetical protein
MIELVAPPQDGGLSPAPPLQFSLRGDDGLVIREISLREAAEFVAAHLDEEETMARETAAQRRKRQRQA